jgi:hypothetical protein
VRSSTIGGVARAAATLVLAACGGVSTSSSTCSPPPAAPAPPHASSGAVTVVADRAQVPRGGRVELAVSAAGPVSYTAPCDGPASVVVSDSIGLHVADEAPAAAPGEACGAVVLAAGQTAVYTLAWSVDATVPTGRYVAAVTVGDLPEVSVDIHVVGGVQGAPQC